MSEYSSALQNLYQDFGKAQQINLENLKTILSDNANTRFGLKYNFSEIHSEEEYRSRVPFTDYSAYEAEIDVPGAFTAYPVRCTLVTSGTTGKQKQFHLTDEALRRCSSAIHEMPYYLTGTEGDSMHVSVFRGPDQNGKMLLSSAYHRWLRDCGVLDRFPFVGGDELLFSDEIGDVAYVKTWLALAHPDLVFIQTVYLYDALLFFRHLEASWRDILGDMRAGRVSADLPSHVKAQLLRFLPSSNRIAELGEILEGGFSRPIARRLWKKLRLIIGIGGKMFTLQQDALKGYIGDISICHCVYGASECLLGVPIALDRAEYALIPRSAYLEFYSADTAQFVPMSALQPGKSYELAVTTFSGLYRYRMDDVVRIVSFIGEAPVVEVVSRNKNVLNIAGEKIDEASMKEAIRRWAEKTGVLLDDAAVGVDVCDAPGRYYLFIENKSPLDKERAAFHFDMALRSVSPDYDDVRRLSMLAQPRIHTVPTGSISASKFEGENTAGHSKPRTFLDNKQVEFLIKRSKTHEEHK